MGRAASGTKKVARQPTSAELSSLCAGTKFTPQELRIIWAKFKAVSESQVQDGLIDVSEFKTAVGLRSDGFSQRIFAAFDLDGSHEIDFEEFVLGLHALSPRATPREKARFCFSVFDIDGNGVIDRSELEKVMMYSLSENTSVRLTEQQLKNIIDRTYRRVDMNGDGVISFEEFQSEAEKNPTILACVSINMDTLMQL
jgi:serine/threonine-protein phosphatase 2B regulatory subunit